MKIIIIAAAVVLLPPILYVGYVFISEWIAVKAAPREEMLLCAKHGPIRMNGTIDFYGQRYCGLCFHQRLESAERGEFK